MRWFRDTQSLLGARLRTLLVLGLVFVLVAEIPLGVVGSLSTWLPLVGAGIAAGSVQVPPDGPGAPELAAAKRKDGKPDKDEHGKRTRTKTDKHTSGKPDKNDTKDQPGTGHTGKKDQDQAGQKGTHLAAGKGKDKAHKQGQKDHGTGEGKRQAKRGASGSSAAAVSAAAAEAPLTLLPWPTPTSRRPTRTSTMAPRRSYGRWRSGSGCRQLPAF